MPRRRHRKPNRPHVIEKSQLERADEVKRELQANGFQISGIQFWKKNKLSDAIRKLIGPYQAEADSYDSYYSLVGFACVAWNASLAEESERSKMVDDFLKAMLKRGAPRRRPSGKRIDLRTLTRSPALSGGVDRFPACCNTCNITPVKWTKSRITRDIHFAEVKHGSPT